MRSRITLRKGSFVVLFQEHLEPTGVTLKLNRHLTLSKVIAQIVNDRFFELYVLAPRKWLFPWVTDKDLPHGWWAKPTHGKYVCQVKLMKIVNKEPARPSRLIEEEYNITA